jgi:hypothetical protein
VLVVGNAVWREAVEDGERFGYQDAQRIRRAHADEFVRRVALDDALSAMAGNIASTWRLGQGESETLALGQSARVAIVDDGRAARVAAALGIQPVSTLFLPVLGIRGELSAVEARRFLHELAVVMSARAEAIFEIEKHLGRSP